MLKERGTPENKSSTPVQVPQAGVLASQAHCEAGLPGRHHYPSVSFVDQSQWAFYTHYFSIETNKSFNIHLLSFSVGSIRAPSCPSLFTEPDQGNAVRSTAIKMKGGARLQPGLMGMYN